MPKFIIYHSGDKGSQELFLILGRIGITYEKRDIRENKQHLTDIAKRGLTTVPQVFNEFNVCVGDFETTLASLDIVSDEWKMMLREQGAT